MRRRAIRLMLLAKLALVLGPLAWATPCESHSASAAAVEDPHHHAPAPQERAPVDCLAPGCPMLHPMPAAPLVMVAPVPPQAAPIRHEPQRLAGTDPAPALPPPRRAG
jgi:hypothetical protein